MSLGKPGNVVETLFYGAPILPILFPINAFSCFPVRVKCEKTFPCTNPKISYTHGKKLLAQALNHEINNKGVGLIPAGERIVYNEFFSSVSGLNYNMCMTFTQTKTPFTFKMLLKCLL